MSEKPILFSGPMVQAILNGTKTQTRRIVKSGIEQSWPLQSEPSGEDDGTWYFNGGAFSHVVHCPFGKRGDRLWVRETWCCGSPFDGLKPSKLSPPTSTSRLAVDYQANSKRVWGREDQGVWRPSIHMPRWASRLTLEITAIRVERLQDISEEDAVCEGCSPTERAGGTLYNGAVHPIKGTLKVFPCAKAAYRSIWESIHGPGSWDANPWVFVIEFRKIDG